MALLEVPMVEVREALRPRRAGADGIRAVAHLNRVDRKSVRRRVGAAIDVVVWPTGGVALLADGLSGRVVDIVRPLGVDGQGHA